MSTAEVLAPAPEPPRTEHVDGSARIGRSLFALAGLAVTAWLVINTFLAMAFYPGWFLGNQVLIAIVGVVAGVGGAALLFFFLNVFIESLPRRFAQGLIPYAFLLPGIGFIALMLLYPTVQTINYSFANDDSTEYVGLRNYIEVFQDDQFWLSITNNALWLLIVPALTVAFGVIIALFADRLSPQGEKVAKGFVFLPMAISFVGASAIWKLVYDANAEVGLLNAIVTGLGGEAQDWLRFDAARINSLLMMVILVWLQAGFAMILLSGAIKAVPEDTLEAARIDGANEAQIFWRVIVPQIQGTIITVFITVVIMVLKIFDIVYVLTNGQNRSNVVANLFFQELFTRGRAGHASAIVVILLLLVIPIVIYQVRQYRKESAA